MAIPESQLDTWSGQGAITTARQTYDSIKNALGSAPWPSGNSPNIYLQGSYRNDTNIYSESDVDIVVELPYTFRSDLSALNASEIAAYASSFENATYSIHQAYVDAVIGLNSYFGADKVKSGGKAIKVQTPYRQADVVIAIEHRKYRRFISLDSQQYASGIELEIPGTSTRISNFPKQHYDNGVAKQQRTNDLYKPAVRMLKNANRYVVERGLIAEGKAPSYGIECLVYSVPDEQFEGLKQNIYRNIVVWADVNVGAIRRVSEQGAAVGNGTNQWSTSSAEEFVSAAINLWNTWQN